MKDYLHFWGKARGEQPGEPAWHPLVYHSLDVAAVADQLLLRFPRQLERLAAMFETTPDNLRAILVAMIALHDVGKFGKGFQIKVREHWPTPVLGPCPAGSDGLEGDHVVLASAMRREGLQLRIAFSDWTEGWKTDQLYALWHAVSGHHGRPKHVQAKDDLSGDLPDAALAALQAFRDETLRLFPDRKLFAKLKPGDRRLAVLTWYAAGLTVAADWIGSKRAPGWFPYLTPGPDVADYWRIACKRAQAAVSASGLLPAAPNTDLTLDGLLPDRVAASPLQKALDGMDLDPGPSLTIVEDVTGSGKTEAALMLAARLVRSGQGSGLFFALPTMATADAMYRRMAPMYRRLFAGEARPSLVLAHGRRDLNDGFTGSLQLAETLIDLSHDADESSAMCAAWLADDRRKVFLAHAGVGTVDQALLSVLPSKHQSLRLWGLADKVLIIDEVHCYDAYMSRELETLLEFHAALGGSAILLSATLPVRERRKLMSAFARGLGRAEIDADPPSSYPLVSITSAAGERYLEPDTRPDRHRRLGVRRISTPDDAVGELVSAARKGAAVAWIRNSVDDAIEALRLVKSAESALMPVLLHARFPMGRRLEIEEQVRETLGRGERDGRRGYVLIGTQILEASLDYDVDLMVTDLAPIDLMIQRAGRIWRHTERDPALRAVDAPELVVLSPDPSGPGITSDWYRVMSKRAAAVYRHHGIVWRSASTLLSEGLIETPGRVRRLVEAVYGREPHEIDDVPQGLHKASVEVLGRDSAARTFAAANLLEVANGYAGNLQIWGDDTMTPTRLGQEVTTFRLAEWNGKELLPLFRHARDTGLKSWSLSEVQIATYRADSVDHKGELREAANLINRGWPVWEQNTPIVALERSGDTWKGQVASNGSPRLLSYHPSIGCDVTMPDSN